ncbi:MAG: hypothetical protein R3C51_15230 [Parvularculaceae bacterium]
MTDPVGRSIKQVLVARRDAAQADFMTAVHDYDQQARIVDDLDRALREADVCFEDTAGPTVQTKHRRYLLATRASETARLEAALTRKDAARAALEEALSEKISFELLG